MLTHKEIFMQDLPRYIVLCDFDCDTTMTHPVSEGNIKSINGIFKFNVFDKKTFLNYLITNKFNMSEKVHSAICWLFESEQFNELVDFDEGSYYFGNYTISIYDINNGITNIYEQSDEY